METLIAENLRLSNEEVSAVEDYNATKAELNSRIKKVTEKSKIEAENLKHIKEIQEKKKEELKLVFQSYKDLQTILETSKKYQDDLRSKINKVLEDITDIERVNDEIYRNLSQSQQAHK